MSANPTGLESDLLGRPAGLHRVHVVDSSVFPTRATDDDHLHGDGERPADRRRLR